MTKSLKVISGACMGVMKKRDISIDGHDHHRFKLDIVGVAPKSFATTEALFYVSTGALRSK